MVFFLTHNFFRISPMSLELSILFLIANNCIVQPRIIVIESYFKIFMTSEYLVKIRILYFFEILKYENKLSEISVREKLGVNLKICFEVRLKCKLFNIEIDDCV